MDQRTKGRDRVKKGEASDGLMALMGRNEKQEVGRELRRCENEFSPGGVGTAGRGGTQDCRGRGGAGPRRQSQGEMSLENGVWV